jgi:hypothetical protein
MNPPEPTGAAGPVLSYHRPGETSRPGLLGAAVLGFPSLASLLLLASILFRRLIPSPLFLPWLYALRLGMLFWAAAIVMGLFSLAYYRRQRKPWYVVICLAVNSLVLLATAALLGALAYAQWQFR